MVVGMPIQCQQEPPIWGAVKKETVFSADSLMVIRYGCENGRAEAPLGQALFSWAAPFREGLLHSALARHPLWFSSSQGCSVSSLPWKVAPEPAGSWLT